ncbi:MAG TPA: HDOD domain-containing protein [Opitutaceae bacterium]|nr:HDOD domain-containing protein [Opitutaceae bacterium]
MIATPVSRETLLHVVKLLPAAPQILSQLGQLLLDINSDLSEVTRLLRRDAGLTARIIRVANSAYYGAGLPASSLEEALARVGFREVYRLTGFAAAAQLADQRLAVYDISGVQLRENALLTALLMEDLALAAGVDGRAAYTAGLLRSTGKIALDRVLRQDPSAVVPATITHLGEWEQQVAGLDNCAAAAVILGEWRFPRDLITTIGQHYVPPADTHPMASLLNLAAGEAERAGFGLVGEGAYWEITPAKLRTAGVTAADLGGASVRALNEFATLRAVLA